MYAILALSLAVIALLTLAPVEQESELRPWPFSEIGEAILEPDFPLLLESLANVLLFAPFGAVLRLHGVHIAKAALAGLLLSSAVEALQFVVISGRTTSTDDVLLNTVGAVLGNALAARWVRHV